MRARNDSSVEAAVPAALNVTLAGETPATTAAFTVLELLVVITIIIALAGLILSTVGYAQKKGARSRAEAEIAGISAALESYKADNGIYPTDATVTEQVDPTASPVPPNASLYLYKQLSGDVNANLQPPAGAKSYFTFKPQMLAGAKDSNGALTSVTNLRDPFGNPYGYSTMRAANPTGSGFNPTFDLWSTAGTTTVSATDQAQWIKNW